MPGCATLHGCNRVLRLQQAGAQRGTTERAALGSRGTPELSWRARRRRGLNVTVLPEVDDGAQE
eukprot:2537774-Alexandrium_andersonii.AAC.1